MKRIMAWMLTMIVALSASFTAFAAESNLDGENRQTDIGVYARYNDNTQWNTVPVDDNGRGTTTLPDGTVIAVRGDLKPGCQLVIDPITETDAKNWISGILDGKAANLTLLHIYFIDSSGNTMAATGVTVTIKLPNKLTDPVAYSLISAGKTAGLTVTAKDGSLTFTTDGSPYYVLGERVTTPVAKTYTVQGTVKRNGQPVEGITIELRSMPKTDVTDSSGRFSFRDVECGKHSLTAIENGKIVGYVEFVLTEGSTANLSLSNGIYIVTANKNEIGINLTLNLADNGTMSMASVTGIQAGENPDGGNSGEPAGEAAFGIQAGGNPNGGNKDNTNSPQTSDDTNLLLWLVWMLIAFAGFVAIFVYSRKKRTG